MNTFMAVTIIEDTPDATDEQLVAAWQSLIDSGVVWQLQGWYGRTATRLIEAGFVTNRNTRAHNQ